MTKKMFLMISTVFILLGDVRIVSADTDASKQAVALSAGQDMKEGEKDALERVKVRKQHNQHSVSESRIYSASMRPNVVYRLQTALGYTTTIDLPEPALKVFIGDQEYFKVGVYEKEVVIKPITDDASAKTNLTIITKSSRITFDVSVGSPETANYVFDFRERDQDALVENAFEARVNTTESKLKENYKEKESALDKKAVKLSQEKLKEEVKKGNETALLKTTKESGEVRLNLLSLSTIGDKAYLRFGVRNLSANPYKIREAVVGVQTYEPKTLGLRKEKEGVIQIPSELEMKNPVPASSYEYGVLAFDRRALKKGEKPVFLLFEDEGTRNFKLEGFHWLD